MAAGSDEAVQGVQMLLRVLGRRIFNSTWHSPETDQGLSLIAILI